jgi:cyclophilin family peptidyl-prolyl cis-trans isomerase
MNYSFSDLPDSGSNPQVYFDIKLKNDIIGRIGIRLFREVFPAGVENFVGIASGKTYKADKIVSSAYGHSLIKETKRTYDDCNFYQNRYNNYIMTGDIYNNNGTSSGTIYFDEPISFEGSDYVYAHDTKGLVSLVPFYDEATKKYYYDSTFLITLDNVKPSNVLSELNTNHIVIGQVFDGMQVLDKINTLLIPYAGRKYPDFSIAKTTVNKKLSNRHTTFYK